MWKERIKLSLIFIFVVYFVYQCVSYYFLRENYTDDSKIPELKSIVKEGCRGGKAGDSFDKVCEKIDETPIFEDKQSYTINKDKIFLCLYDKNKRYYSNNMLIYVLLHEFSHKLCKSVGHTDEFHRIFKQVLDDAVKRGIYNPNEPIDENYCKHNVEGGDKS